MFGLFVSLCIPNVVNTITFLEMYFIFFCTLSALVRFGTWMKASSFGVKVQGHVESNMLENARFGLVNAMS